MKLFGIMNLSLLIFFMIDPTSGAKTRSTPRSNRNSKKTARNRSPFSKSLVKGITDFGTKFISRKKTKKNTTNPSNGQSTSHALRDAAIDVGGQLAVNALGSGITRGATAVDIVASQVSPSPTEVSLNFIPILFDIFINLE